MTREDVELIFAEAQIGTEGVDALLDFLLYYGVLGIRTDGSDHYIYSVNYDLKILKIGAGRVGTAVRYVVNPAFWPALDVREVANDAKQATLAL